MSGPGPNHRPLIRPGIRRLTSFSIGTGPLDFENRGMLPEDFLHMSITRTVTEVPEVDPSLGWQHIVEPWVFVGAPAYRLHLWKYFRPGDVDPLPDAPARKRVRIFRGARLKPGSAVTSVNSALAMTVPARACAKAIYREWSVYDLYVRSANTGIGTYHPPGTDTYYTTASMVNNETGGDSHGASNGWPEFPFTMTAAGPAYALAYVLEPRNS